MPRASDPAARPIPDPPSGDRRPDPEADAPKSPKMENLQQGGPLPGDQTEDPAFRGDHPPAGSRTAERRRG